MCRNNFHHQLKYLLYLLVLYVKFSVKCLKIAPKWPLSYFQPILIPDFNTSAIVLINEREEIGENNFDFSLKGGPMHVAL